jgi:hypothetical protein
MCRRSARWAFCAVVTGIPLVWLASAPGRAMPPRTIGRTAVNAPAADHAVHGIAEEARRLDADTLRIQNGIYRASFTRASGMAFTPRVDGVYDERLTWRYRARALAVGSRRTVLADVDPMTTRAADHVVEFRRPGLVERYVGEPHGVEQVFVLTERPREKGDVRVRGEVTFAGHAEQAEGRLEFAGHGAGRLTYGRPVAFDAARCAIPVRAELKGATLDLVLDGDALERATFPVTIDPLLSGPTTTYAGYGARNVDLAYNWTLGEFLLVFSAESASVG